MNNENGQVAILIDFENLVRGVSGQETIDCEVIFKLAEDYGRVLMANAYADWRMKDVNQYQTDLYRLGIELVHVFGKFGAGGFKNAVDVKMAVDAITATSLLPHIGVFVIVSGDRDFIHVLKALRRQGKTVVGVSPASATSDDFAALCDRFVRYESLAATYEYQTPQETHALSDHDLTDVRRVLQEIMAENPNGIKGALIKPSIRRKLSPTFDESAYGFQKLIDLLRHLDDIVKIDTPVAGGDITVFPVSCEIPERAAGLSGHFFSTAKSAAQLSRYRYEQHCEKRRTILRRLFAAMYRDQPFAWLRIEQEILEQESQAGISLTVTILSRYRTLIYQSRGFVAEQDQDDLPQRERLFRLRSDIQSADALIELYETAITYKVATAIDADTHLHAHEVSEILGLSPSDQADLEYCQKILDRCNNLLGQQAFLEDD